MDFDTIGPWSSSGDSPRNRSPKHLFPALRRREVAHAHPAVVLPKPRRVIAPIAPIPSPSVSTRHCAFPYHKLRSIHSPAKSISPQAQVHDSFDLAEAKSWLRRLQRSDKRPPSLSPNIHSFASAEDSGSASTRSRSVCKNTAVEDRTRPGYCSPSREYRRRVKASNEQELAWLNYFAHSETAVRSGERRPLRRREAQ